MVVNVDVKVRFIFLNPVKPNELLAHVKYHIISKSEFIYAVLFYVTSGYSKITSQGYAVLVMLN